MKTEQEQIEQIIKIFTDNREVCHHMRCVECKYHGDEDCVYSSCANALYQAGYGDVSEYKAEREMLGSQIKVLKQRLNNKYVEIERLKDDYAKLQEQFAQYQMASDKEIKAQKKEAEQLFESNMKAVLEIEKKQAQIDVLNKAKERLDSAPNGWAYTTYIDKLIEEIEQ